MKKNLFLSLLIPLLFLENCNEKKQQVVAKKSEIQKVDPLLQLKTRFKKTYFQIACMANEGIDPLSSIVPLKKPFQYLEGLSQAKSPRLSNALEILRENGFSGIEDFKSVEMELRKDKKFWEEIEVKFVDELLKCPAGK